MGSLAVAHTLRAEGHDASEDGTGRGVPLVPVCGHDTGQGWWNESEVAGTLRSEGDNRPSRPSNIVAYQCHGSNVGPMGTFRSGNGNESGGVPFMAFAQNQRDELREMSVAGALAAEPGMKQQTYVNQMGVRRLTPRECERLQGFPDDWTRYDADGKELSDSARYRMLGNAVAVPVAAWIGRRIMEVIQ